VSAPELRTSKSTTQNRRESASSSFASATKSAMKLESSVGARLAWESVASYLTGGIGDTGRARQTKQGSVKHELESVRDRMRNALADLIRGKLSVEEADRIACKYLRIECRNLASEHGESATIRSMAAQQVWALPHALRFSIASFDGAKDTVIVDCSAMARVHDQGVTKAD